MSHEPEYIPTFAVVIPLYQKRATVEAALRSVAMQTLPAAEILIVDDASTDGGDEVVAGFLDPRVRMFKRAEPGPGGYAARNLAIAHARAEWIAFLDADDVWRPDHLATLARGIVTRPGVGCVASRYRHVFADRTETDRVARRLQEEDTVVRVNFASFLECWLEARACPVWTGAVAIRREVLLAGDGFPEDRAARGGDKDLWLRTIRLTDMAFVSRSTAEFSREIPGKLTDRVDTRSLPCLIHTARTMMKDASADEQRLLRQLINQEIMLYARWTARSGGRASLGLRDLSFPPSLMAIVTLLAISHLPRSWLRRAYRLEHHRRQERRNSRTVALGAFKPNARIAVVGLRGVPNVIGGIETHCELLYPALAHAASDLSPVLLVRQPYSPARTYQLGPVAVHSLPSPRRRGLETLVHTLRAVIHARFRMSADLVHLHGIGPGFFAPLARALGLNVVVTHHAADFERRKWGGPARTFLRLGEGMTAQFAHAVICVSHALQRDFLSRHPRAASRTTVIRHAAHLADPQPKVFERLLAELGVSAGGYFLAVGRLDETKRFDDLIRAHSELGPETLRLVIVGGSMDGQDHEEHLRALAGSGVIFAGQRIGQELASLYKGAALFIHASEMEGFGLVVLEAMMAGLPIRLSDIPAHREFALPDSDYFPVGDHVAIARLFQAASSGDLEPIDHASAIARHQLDVSVAAHADLFHKVLKRSARARAPSRISIKNAPILFSNPLDPEILNPSATGLRQPRPGPGVAQLGYAIHQAGDVTRIDQ
jgi:glycosyltransferase involved in cell wall biosynthesis